MRSSVRAGMNRSIDTVTAGTSSVMPPSQVTERWPLAIAPNQEWIAMSPTAG